MQRYLQSRSDQDNGNHELDAIAGLMEKLSLELLAREIMALRTELEEQKRVNKEQSELLQKRQASLLKQQQESRRGLEVLTVAILGFFLFILTILTGLRLELGWASFQIPPNLLESGAIVAGITAATKYFMDKQNN